MSELEPALTTILDESLRIIYDLTFMGVTWRVSWLHPSLDMNQWGGSILSHCCHRPVHLSWLSGRKNTDHMICAVCNHVYSAPLEVRQGLMDGRPLPWVLATEQPGALLWWLEEAWDLDGLESELWRAAMAVYRPPIPDRWRNP